jgi:L-amino acid N-acyltransferase YncA
MNIIAMRPEHWPSVASIYDAGIATGNATFETSAPTRDTWNAAHRQDLRFVGIDIDEVVGWVAAGNVSDRCCYAGVIEHSVYVAPGRQCSGIGSALVRALIEAAERTGVWTIQTGIFPENTASLVLHERCGFRVVGTRKRLGKLGDTWRDVVLIERRSDVIY